MVLLYMLHFNIFCNQFVYNVYPQLRTYVSENSDHQVKVKFQSTRLLFTYHGLDTIIRGGQYEQFSHSPLCCSHCLTRC